MNVSCSNCPAKYAVPDEKVRGRKVRITCKRCGAAIIVDGTAADGGEAATGKLSGATAASVRPAAQASVAKAATGPRPAVAVPSVGGTSASVTGRTMKRTMVGIPGPAADAAPAPAPGTFPSPAPVALREQPKREEPKRPAEQASGKSFAKQTMVGGIAVTPRREPVPAPPPPAPAEEWTVAVTDETHEPMTLTQIISAYAAGRIDAETFIWKEGMPDWQMPFEIPVIEAALRAKGFRPSRLAPPPAATPEPAHARALSGYDENAHEKPTAVSESPFDGGFPDAGGMWREPGRWNEAGSPFADRPGASPYKEEQEERELPSFSDSGEGGISFDDVTVAMRAPEAEKLLKEAADESGPRMVGEADSEQKIPTTGWDLSEFGPAPGDETIKYDKTKHPAINEFRGVDEEDAAAAIPAELAPPPAAAPKPRPMARAAVRRPPEEAKADLFSGSASTETVEEPIDGGANKDALKMTGARNESSVLFSLDAMMKSEGKPPAKKVEAPKKEHDVLLGGGIPATDARFGTALAAPDFSAPVAESVPPKAIVESRAAASSVEAERPSAGGGWLWAAIVVVALIVIGVALWFLRPAWLVSALPGVFPAPPSTASAEPPAPTTAAATATATAATPAAPAPEAADTASGAPPATAPAAAGKPAPPSQPAARPAPAAAKPAAPASAPAAEKTPAAEPGPASDLPPFDKSAAAAALNSAAANVASCKQEGGPVGTGRAAVTFAPSGRATNAIISGDFAGTAVGGCVARLFRQTRVGPFSGEPVTVAKSFTIQ